MSAPGSSSALLSQDSESQGSESRGSALSHFATSFLTGGFSAAATKTLFAPIDRVKIVLQTQDSNPSIRNGTHRRFEGVSHTFRRIYAEQGLTAFWRGNTASVLRSFPTQSLNFAFWGTIKGTLLPEDSAHTTSRFVLAHIGGGALAGALTTTIVHPLDMARTRMAVDLTGRVQPRHLRHLPDYMKQIWHQGGVRGLYSGIGAGIVGVSVYRGLYFGLFEVFKNMKRSSDDGRREARDEAVTLAHSGVHLVAPLIPDAFVSSDSSSGQHVLHEAERLSWQWVCAQSAAVCAGLSAYPFDSVRHRMMAASASMYTSSLDCAAQVWRTEGLAGFYRGVTLGVLNWCGAAVLLVIHDEVQQLMHA